jgi:hypothetical protein
MVRRGDSFRDRTHESITNPAHAFSSNGGMIVVFEVSTFPESGDVLDTAYSVVLNVPLSNGGAMIWSFSPTFRGYKPPLYIVIFPSLDNIPSACRIHRASISDLREHIV